MVGRVVTTLYGDGWVVNPTAKLLTLKKNAKVADVSPCSSVQDLPDPKRVQSCAQYTADPPVLLSEVEITKTLDDMGLHDLDIASCEISLEWKNKLLHIIERYNSMFSRHNGLWGSQRLCSQDTSG